MTPQFTLILFIETIYRAWEGREKAEAESFIAKYSKKYPNEIM